jgi:hypothetical protein
MYQAVVRNVRYFARVLPNVKTIEGSNDVKRAVHGLLWDMRRCRRRINAHRRDTPSQDRSDALLCQAQQVIAQLRQEGTSITLREVQKRLQLSRYVLQHYPVAWQYIQDQRHLDMQQRDEQALRKVRQAVEELCANGEEITMSATCRMTGVSLDIMKSKPQIQSYLSINTGLLQSDER